MDHADIKRVIQDYVAAADAFAIVDLTALKFYKMAICPGSFSHLTQT